MEIVYKEIYYERRLVRKEESPLNNILTEVIALKPVCNSTDTNLQIPCLIFERYYKQEIHSISGGKWTTFYARTDADLIREAIRMFDESKKEDAADVSRHGKDYLEVMDG